MKKIMLFIGLLILFVLTGCSSGVQERENQEKNQATDKPKNNDLKNAEEIIAYFKEKNGNIAYTKIYNEENDPNELLGRPGGYIGKVDFIDSGVEEKFIEGLLIKDKVLLESVKREMREDFKVKYGGSIEVFDNKKDAKKRFEYVTTTAQESGGAFTEYGYLHKNIFLRLSKSLTPAQAEAYDQILTEFVERN
ncbi:hypothetical protein [Bacillus sp. USDA818B3_A]|uniref:hypothetical protein n=1 Tax=Bacillus sp. USDA818B3_A TaxID=2698834 RepID=UPI001F2C8B0F|nr:hypothetical protein [Bacillus sp. USDA818B3_A]